FLWLFLFRRISQCCTVVKLLSGQIYRHQFFAKYLKHHHFLPDNQLMGLCSQIMVLLLSYCLICFFERYKFTAFFPCPFLLSLFIFPHAPNGLRLGAGGDFYHKTCYEAESSNLRKTVIRSTKPPLVPNRCYGLPFFCRISPIPNVKSPKVSIALPTY